MACPPRQGYAGGTRHGAFENIPADDPIRSTFTIYKKRHHLAGEAGGVRKGNERDEEQGVYGRSLPSPLSAARSVISEFHTSVKIRFLKSPTTN